jgi:3-hydroxyisobutyrate dehydrogenase-like beta-hydroxyacid dehydrogenase
MGQRSFIVGGTPAQANLVKLTGNFLMTCAIESLAEAFALTAKSGIEIAKVYELLTETPFAAPVYKTCGENPRKPVFPSGFQDGAWSKGQPAGSACGRDTRGALAFAAIVRDRFLAALAHGDGELDWCAIAKRAAEDAGAMPLGLP